MNEVRDIEDADASVERVVQHLPVGVSGVFQRLDSLLADGFRRYQPEDQGMVLFDPGITD